MCVSSRRRPITSPPGGGTTARPKRASSGPASRNEARISRQSSGSSVGLRDAGCRRATSFGPVQRASAPMSTSSSTITSTSRMRGTFVSRTSLGGEHGRSENRQRAVLVPGRADRAGERATALDDERLHEAGGYRTRRRGRDPRQRLGDADALHEERVAPPSRARGRGVDALVRPPLRRGRGAVGLHGAAPRLRLRDPPHARQAPAGRRADPARGGLPRGPDPGRALARRAPRDPARDAAARRRCSPATSSRASSTPAGSCARPGSRASSRSRCARS